MFLFLYFPSWLDTNLLLLQGPVQALTFPEAPRDRSGPGDDPPAQSHVPEGTLGASMGDLGETSGLSETWII